MVFLNREIFYSQKLKPMFASMYRTVKTNGRHFNRLEPRNQDTREFSRKYVQVFVYGPP